MRRRIGGTAKTSVGMSCRRSWPSGRVGWRSYRRPCRRWKPRRRRLTNRPRPKVVSIRGCPTTKPSATSFTDAESRIIPAPGGKDFPQAHNCQAVVDSAHHVILAVRATRVRAIYQRNCSDLRGSADYSAYCGGATEHGISTANRFRPLKREQLPTSNCLPQRSTANWVERWNNSGSLFPRWPSCCRTPRRTSWPSRPSQWPTGRSCE